MNVYSSLFTTAPKCPSTWTRMNVMGFIRTVEYRSVIKRTKCKRATVWMNLANTTQVREARHTSYTV